MAIERLPPPTFIKAIRSFLGHTGFYRRFIRHLSKIAKPLACLLEKGTYFNFDKECLEGFNTLKKKSTTSPVLVAPDWSKPLEIMCDASDLIVRAILGQKEGK